MNKKLLKLIIELIYIFILPIAFMLISVKSEVVNTYDENGNLLTSDKVFDFSEDSILRDYNDNITYKNTLYINQVSTDYIQTQVLNDFNIINNNNIINVNGIPNTNTYVNFLIIKDRFLELEHKYVILTNNNINSVVAQINDSYETFTNYYFFTCNSSYNNIKRIFNLYVANSEYNQSYCINIIDLTIMFGSGYEPTTYNELLNYIDDSINLVDSEVIVYSNDIISENYEYNYTWYTKIFNEFYDNLQINNNIVIKLITTYIILWVIMFLTWHLLYRFIDFMAHLFDKKG